MAAFISFDESCTDRIWSSANWVFRSLIDHAISLVDDDERLCYELTLGNVHQTIELGNLIQEERAVGHRMVAALVRVCDDVRTGECVAMLNGKKMDGESQIQFQQAIAELSERLAHQFS